MDTFDRPDPELSPRAARSAAAAPGLAPLFVSHGSPMTALQPGEAGAFWRRLGQGLRAHGARPRAVLAVSAHTLAREPVVLGAARHAAVYDFGGFDPALRTLRYDVPGDPALARAVQQRLHAAGWPVHLVDEGGLDHGIWVPLRSLLPEADVPVVPLAWPPGETPARLFALGQALAPLAAEGVWVIGTGSLTHNLGRVFGRGGAMAAVDAPATAESTAFRDWFAARARAGDRAALLDWQRAAPHARLMHPSDEHLLPFFVAAGAGAGPGTDTGTPPASMPPAVRLHASLTHGDLAMDAYAFGPQAAALAAFEAEAPQGTVAA